MRCDACQGEINANDAFCSHCGAKVPVTLKCPSCRTDIPPDAKLCPICGAALSVESEIFKVVHDTYEHDTSEHHGDNDSTSSAPKLSSVESEIFKVVHDAYGRDTSEHHGDNDSTTSAPKLSKRYAAFLSIVASIGIIWLAYYFVFGASWFNSSSEDVREREGTAWSGGTNGTNATFERLPAPDLRVETSGAFGLGEVRITNVGRDEIKITDISINGRDECTRQEGQWLALRVGSERSPPSTFCSVDAKSFPAFVAHAVWLAHDSSFYYPKEDGEYEGVGCWCFGCVSKPLASRRLSLKVGKPPPMKVGEAQTWISQCRGEIVRVTVTTDHGTGTYSWK